MQSVSPVYDEEHVQYELIIALDQSEYAPLVILPTLHPVGPTKVQGMTVRFRLTDEERILIAQGADLLISELTFGNKYTPLSLWLEVPPTEQKPQDA